MKFIKLTLVNGQRIYINMWEIVSLFPEIARNPINDISVCSEITTTRADESGIYNVKESPEEIFKLIEEAGNELLSGKPGRKRALWEAKAGG